MKNKGYLVLLSCAAVSLFLSTNTYAADTSLYTTIKSQVNPSTNINFGKKATIATGNGNGVNKYTENGTDIYYFRGEINNNNVIWADKCWKIVRTTATGGIKMIYNGLPTYVVVDGETVKQCNATGADSQITVNVNGASTNTFKFNNNSNSPADVGYMYGTRIEGSNLSSVSSTVFTFSNDVSRSGNTYTLDTSDGQSISGTWADERLNAAVRYHYFCTDGATSCDNTKIGYIYFFANSSIIYYLKVDGYDNIEDMKTAMFTNTTDSNAKAMVETWFEQQNLDGHETGTKNYEDDLEDAIFCNDRSYYTGALKNKDSDATPESITTYNHHGAFGRDFVADEPSLDCINTNDAFTKDDITNGNAKLNHKIGLATRDELLMAGVVGESSVYLYSGQLVWSASPHNFGNDAAIEYNWNSGYGYNYTDEVFGLRPLVSLKAGTTYNQGNGTKDNPYIIDSSADTQDKEGDITPETIPDNPKTRDDRQTMLYIASASMITILAFTKVLLKRR